MRDTRTLRVLQIGKSTLASEEAGGLDRVFHALIRYLPDVGVPVQGLVVGTRHQAVPEEPDVRTVVPRGDSLAARLIALRRSIRQELDSDGYDLVAAHFPLYAVPVLDKMRPRPVVVHFHGPWALESRAEGENALKVGLKAILERSVYGRSSRFVVLSQAFGAILQQTFGVSENQIRIIPGGVDVSRFDSGMSKREARSRLGWPQDRPVILSVRRLVRRMGLENLISATRNVVERFPEALLYIAGRGPLRPELQSRIEACGLQKHVDLLGFVPDADLPVMYGAADLSIVPTIELEGFGLTTIESLAAGTPVLVTPVGGLPEVVQNFSSEMIIPGTQPEVLGDYLISALDGTLRLPSSAACREYAQSRFDWPVIARQVKTVYEEVVS